MKDRKDEEARKKT